MKYVAYVSCIFFVVVVYCFVEGSGFELLVSFAVVLPVLPVEGSSTRGSSSSSSSSSSTMG